MQVRPIEFQESFARVPVEMARQQHVLQREPDLARDQAARVHADARLLDLSRPVETTETEGAVIQSEQERTPARPRRQSRPLREDEVLEENPKQPPLGRHIDVII